MNEKSVGWTSSVETGDNSSSLFFRRDDSVHFFDFRESSPLRPAAVEQSMMMIMSREMYSRERRWIYVHLRSPINVSIKWPDGFKALEKSKINLEKLCAMIQDQCYDWFLISTWRRRGCVAEFHSHFDEESLLVHEFGEERRKKSGEFEWNFPFTKTTTKLFVLSCQKLSFFVFTRSSRARWSQKSRRRKTLARSM